MCEFIYNIHHNQLRARLPKISSYELKREAECSLKRVKNCNKMRDLDTYRNCIIFK